MSSILKALKQLETESDPQAPSRDLPSSWRKRPGAEKPSNAKPASRRSRPGYGVLLAAVLIALMGVFLLNRPDRPAPPSAGPLAYKVKAAVPPLPAKAAPTTAPRQPQSAAAPPPAIPAVTPKPGTPPIESPAAAERRPGSAVSPEPTAPRPEPQVPVAEAKRTIATAAVGPTDRGPQPSGPAPEINSVSPRPQTEEAPEHADPRVTIQAIAWSREPADRMAVVNGTIYKEGEVLEGMMVTTIQRDGIIFTEGERRWKQKL